MSETAYLVLENGRAFAGKRFGARGGVTGEVVFTTGMTGYLETLTDPSYYGQIVVQTFPLIGNYGVIPEDFESGAVSCKAYIVKTWCPSPSNFRSEGDVDAFLSSRGIPGLYGIDTRELTKIIRENGVMNGMITSEKPETVNMDEIRGYRIKNAVESVSAKEASKRGGAGRFVVALIDYGAKANISRELEKRGCAVHTLPHCATYKDIERLGAHGIMLSNGPGDPADNARVIENLKDIVKLNKPVFGICLGHQLLALAHGFKTSKLKYGHRGANQPVKDLIEGRVYITSQNHGYAVVSESVDAETAEVGHVNANDGTCEGVRYKSGNVFTVQFHPEACGGPRDTAFLFGRFVSHMEENANA
jgi:carbamoyl-phosphate synthase small subunit